MRRILFFVALTFLMSSCILSIHPLYTEDTLITNDLVLGDWEGHEGKPFGVTTDPTKWSFEAYPDKEKTYLLTHEEDGRQNQYEAHLVKLGDTYFFDLYPIVPNEVEESLGTLAYLLPTHNFFKVQFIDRETIEIIPFDTDYMEKLFKRGAIRIQHEVHEDGNYILTASSEDLQKFFVKYAQNKEAFEDGLTLKKTS